MPRSRRRRTLQRRRRQRVRARREGPSAGRRPRARLCHDPCAGSIRRQGLPPTTPWAWAWSMVRGEPDLACVAAVHGFERVLQIAVVTERIRAPAVTDELGQLDRQLTCHLRWARQVLVLLLPE